MAKNFYNVLFNSVFSIPFKHVIRILKSFPCPCAVRKCVHILQFEHISGKTKHIKDLESQKDHHTLRCHL